MLYALIDSAQPRKRVYRSTERPRRVDRQPHALEIVAVAGATVVGADTMRQSVVQRVTLQLNLGCLMADWLIDNSSLRR